MSDARLTAVLLVLLVLNGAAMVAIAQRVAALSLSRAAAERALLTHRELLYAAPGP
ncbi:MAG: hypothetical protein ACI8RZ_005935 [Myxococcota bacterium]|jgi:hypothetical protein